MSTNGFSGSINPLKLWATWVYVYALCSGERLGHSSESQRRLRPTKRLRNQTLRQNFPEGSSPNAGCMQHAYLCWLGSPQLRAVLPTQFSTGPFLQSESPQYVSTCCRPGHLRQERTPAQSFQVKKNKQNKKTPNHP